MRYVADSVDTPIGGAEQLSLSEVAQLNGGRLPLGVSPESDPGDVSVSRSISREVAVWVDARTGDVLDAEVVESVRTVADLSVGRLPLGHPEEIRRRHHRRDGDRAGTRRRRTTRRNSNWPTTSMPGSVSLHSSASSPRRSAPWRCGRSIAGAGPTIPGQPDAGHRRAPAPRFPSSDSPADKSRYLPNAVSPSCRRRRRSRRRHPRRRRPRFNASRLHHRWWSHRHRHRDHRRRLSGGRIELRLRAVHVRGRERVGHRRDGVRGARRRPHSRGEGEPPSRLQRVLLARPRARYVHAVLPRGGDRTHRHRGRR